MKITFMGTGGFGLPSLEALLRTKHEINAVITMPSRGLDKKKQPLSSPVREFVQKNGILFYDPDNINSEEGLNLLEHLNADLFYVCDFGKILKQEVIAKAKYGAINLHASILPQYRGAAPINWAILAGEKEIGVSIFQLEARMDTGPVLGTDSYFPSEQDTAMEVEQTLAQMGVNLVLKAVRQIELGSVTPVIQNNALASAARRLRKEDGIIQWSQTATSIINQYRGLQPWPKVFTNWYRKDIPEQVWSSAFDGENRSASSGSRFHEAGHFKRFESKQKQAPLRLILGPFERINDLKLEERFYDAQPGTILEARNDTILVKTGDSILKILQLQPAGKKNMNAAAFLCGYTMKPGDLLGDEEDLIK